MPGTSRASDGDSPRPPAADLRGITPLNVTRLSDEVADQIRRLIISEDVAEGARLPSERDLAERFGASRPTVSQALRTLALMGLGFVGLSTAFFVVNPRISVAMGESGGRSR